MEKFFLDDCWFADCNSPSRVMVNSRDEAAVLEAKYIQQWIDSNRPSARGLSRGHLLFATSGSTGGGRKWVALSREALVRSAQTVNKHFNISSRDVWAQFLPDFHVGGMGIRIRVREAQCERVLDNNRWNAKHAWHVMNDRGVTQVSLVPTQLYDLVQGGLETPPSLCSAIIGGGRLDDGLYRRARELGWPVVETYGMTETASQIATATVGSRTLRLLDGWEVKTMASEGDDRLMIRGDSLLSGYVTYRSGKVTLEDPKQHHRGWFLTNDRVKIERDKLTVLGRWDRCVKILGELVSLDEVEQRVESMEVVNAYFHNMGEVVSGLAVVNAPDARAGEKLILCVESERGKKLPPQEEGGEMVLSDQESSNERLHASDWWKDKLVPIINKNLPSLYRIESIVIMSQFPRSPIGKPLYASLQKCVEDRMRCD